MDGFRLLIREIADNRIIEIQLAFVEKATDGNRNKSFSDRIHAMGHIRSKRGSITFKENIIALEHDNGVHVKLATLELLQKAVDSFLRNACGLRCSISNHGIPPHCVIINILGIVQVFVKKIRRSYQKSFCINREYGIILYARCSQ